MTEQQKIQTRRLRGEGFGYTTIADMLGIPENTIKSFCRRNGLTGYLGHGQKGDDHFCQNCGLPVRQNPGRKEKKFCSDECRTLWWNSHMDLVKKKAVYRFECKTCHNPFTAYGNSNRKFCSRECYFRSRFGGADDGR